MIHDFTFPSLLLTLTLLLLFFPMTLTLCRIGYLLIISLLILLNLNSYLLDLIISVQKFLLLCSPFLVLCYLLLILLVILVSSLILIFHSLSKFLLSVNARITPFAVFAKFAPLSTRKLLS